jgi:hypothetical protein
MSAILAVIFLVAALYIGFLIIAISFALLAWLLNIGGSSNAAQEVNFPKGIQKQYQGRDTRRQAAETGGCHRLFRETTGRAKAWRW